MHVFRHHDSRSKKRSSKLEPPLPPKPTPSSRVRQAQDESSSDGEMDLLSSVSGKDKLFGSPASTPGSSRASKKRSRQKQLAPWLCVPEMTNVNVISRSAEVDKYLEDLDTTLPPPDLGVPPPPTVHDVNFQDSFVKFEIECRGKVPQDAAIEKRFKNELNYAYELLHQDKFLYEGVPLQGKSDSRLL